MGKRPAVNKEFLSVKEMARRITLLSDDETNEDDVIGYGEAGSLKFVVLNKNNETTELRHNNTDDPTYYVTRWLPLSKKQFKNIIDYEFPQRIALVHAVVDGKEITLQPTPFKSYAKNDLRIRLEDAKVFEEESGITLKTIITAHHEHISTLLVNQPGRFSETYDRFLSAEQSFVNAHNRSPSREELWGIMHSRDKHLARDNFMDKYRDYTKNDD